MSGTIPLLPLYAFRGNFNSLFLLFKKQLLGLYLGILTPEYTSYPLLVVEQQILVLK
jgi:hypothetical protein